RWYLAQSDLRTGRREEAIRHFEQIRGTTPVPAVLAPALLQYARLQIEAGKVNEALAVLSEAGKTHPAPQVREQIEFESGRAMYAALKFPDAADRFETLGNNRSAVAPVALFNASLASLRADDKTKTEREKAELVRRGQLDEAAEVALEQAIVAAERGEKNAGALLQDFVRRLPGHPRVSEAQIALAEMAYHAAPPKLDEAEKNLAAARAAHPTELAVEHADYLAIWLADARGADSDRVIASARDFLRAHQSSPLVAEVRLKLAESHFRRQDFASAQTEFETLAQENPKSALTEQALFLAAQSAMARWRLSIAFLNLILHPTGHRNFSGFIKLDLTRRDCLKSNKNGKQLRRFTKNWWRPMDRAVRKRTRAWGNCGWSISFGNRRGKISLFLSLSYAQKCRIIRV